jgi:cytidine deaminase
MDKDRLVGEAKKASEKSYSPYSKFRVGAALLCLNSSVFSGTNVENRSYGLTICAERSAFFTAISAGITQFQALAIYSPDADYPLPPCGACRQVITEFVSEEFPIYIASAAGEIKTLSAGELYPFNSLTDLSER